MTAEPYVITMMNGDNVEALFGEATAEQQLQCYVLAGNTRGSYLDEDEVIAREQYLHAQPLARNGGCRTWCLYRQDDHTRVLSTCKTITRSFLLSDSECVQELRGYCVTSVVTALLYRGHGLASHLLRCVMRWLDGPGEAAVGLLYSGIPGFYENLGWTALPNTETILSNSLWLEDIGEAYTNVELRSLKDADIEELCAWDIKVLKADADSVRVTTGEEKLTILATADLVKYQHALSTYMGDLWQYEAPKNRGAAYNAHAWLYWFHDFRGRQLYIQRVHNTIQEEEERAKVTTTLLLSAFREARKWNFITVATWDTRPDVRNALETLARVSTFSKRTIEMTRTQRISIRWRNGENRAGPVVMENEAYTWNSRS